MTHPIENLVAKLEQGGFDPRPTGQDSWESRCPAHKGQRQNLSVTKGDNGGALLHCHHEQSCKPADILAPLGLTMADLFPPQSSCDRNDGSGKPKTQRRAHQTPEA